jgi:N-acetylmuramoyl-L-alanine amidase
MNRRKFLIGSSALGLGAIGGGVYWPNRWQYIFIHHSAGNNGNIEFIQKVHRERNKSDPIDAIPYHFIIGNGNGMEEGEVGSDWRWKYNIWGAHLSKNNSLKNFLGIGICLIGNFEKTTVPEKQYASLVQLTNVLMKKYRISKANVLGHGYTKGERTKCPGKYFPMERFLSDIG